MNKNNILIANVVEIINDFKIVINVGSEHGISNNQRFLVYSLSENDLIDPITKENLGKLEIVKGIGKVSHIQNKITTIESATYESSGKKTLKKTNTLFSVIPQEELVEDIQNIQIPFESPNPGDFVKLIS